MNTYATYVCLCLVTILRICYGTYVNALTHWVRSNWNCNCMCGYKMWKYFQRFHSQSAFKCNENNNISVIRNMWQKHIDNNNYYSIWPNMNIQICIHLLCVWHVADIGETTTTTTNRINTMHQSDHMWFTGSPETHVPHISSICIRQLQLMPWQSQSLRLCALFTDTTIQRYTSQYCNRCWCC